MPAEQALGAQRKIASGPGRGGGGSETWRARLEESAALISPLLLLLGLALAGGGFALGERHVAGLAVWLIVVALLVLGAAGRALLARPFSWATGLIGALALLSAFSSFWSGSIELSVTEADRLLVYLGVFLAAFLITQTGQRRERFGEGIAISLIAIALLALASRLLPDLLSVSQGAEAGARLTYPLGYWNGNGVAFGIATGLALWLSRRAAHPGLRWAAVASLPAIFLALYFTYSRGGLLAAAIACGCLIVLSHDRLWLLATLAIGARAWDRFTSPDLQPPSSSASHITNFSGSGRNEFWRVAVDSFEEEPVLGHGAGTFRFSWYRLRHNDEPNTDAHSLYLQAFSDLGVIGGLLVLALIATILWTGFCAWRGAKDPRRDLYAALLGACLAFAICSAIDWFWQIAVLGSVFFLAAGVLVAARCQQLSRLRASGNGHESRRRFGLSVAGLAVAWIAMLALVGPLLVDREIDASNSAVEAGNLASAVSHAENARKIEPWATTPYKQLGLLAEREGNYGLAVDRLDEAIEREEDNWLLYYLRARVNNLAGEKAAARADLAEAQRLNPQENCHDDGFEGCG